MSVNTDTSPPVLMTVRGLVMDPASNSPVVILENSESTAFLPIWIGVCEANSIALEIEGVETPRPMTHDLVQDLLATAGCSVDHIFIHTLDENVFIASIQLRDSSAATHQVDSRPSDAIALALRAKAEILVDPSVLERAVIGESSTEETLRSILEKMRPEDMGEYEM
ncbi:MAG: bifunctional nuclease family protein [Acidobacteria bacterium]|uniref:Bifunctional nuclease family protein n=1 Tax=Candidatus Sulfomarinibacter kjeldsenii TaxID=2885994 RepID=A0A8J7C5U5_9BACT|nr:bifunctional nuclease family protein [Candidatus Sulfomarinibacter kjeldsenii]MBD3871236.1 bifunctional nuclease family protein [Candidatus Sulfomarinibacter kjeldsenii]